MTAVPFDKKKCCSGLSCASMLWWTESLLPDQLHLPLALFHLTQQFRSQTCNRFVQHLLKHLQEVTEGWKICPFIPKFMAQKHKRTLELLTHPNIPSFLLSLLKPYVSSSWSQNIWWPPIIIIILLSAAFLQEKSAFTSCVCKRHHWFFFFSLLLFWGVRQMKCGRLSSRSLRWILSHSTE